MTVDPSAQKSSSAFRTIGEVATELGLPQHVLRFWESKFSHIKPHKRRGGHRYYRPQDIDYLKEIKTLLHEKGFTIKGAQKFLSTRTSINPNQTDLFKETVDKIPQKKNKENPTLTAKDLAELKNIFNELCELKEMLSQAA
jgi:DNA-binding transcriptional MerR regulator